MKENNTNLTASDKSDQKNKNSARARIIKTAVLLVAALAMLAICSELLLPRLLKNVENRNKNGDNGTYSSSHFFYDEEKITENDLAEYEKQIRDMYYRDISGVEAPITAESASEEKSAEKLLFAKYFDAMKNGDNTAYAECFSDEYDSENGLDRFASGEEFSPQRVYDIHVEQLDTLYDEKSGITQSLFDVRYRIYKNSGNFRVDMSDDTAPLIFYVEEKDGNALICDVAYRYGSN